MDIKISEYVTENGGFVIRMGLALLAVGLSTAAVIQQFTSGDDGVGAATVDVDAKAYERADGNRRWKMYRLAEAREDGSLVLSVVRADFEQGDGDAGDVRHDQSAVLVAREGDVWRFMPVVVDVGQDRCRDRHDH